MDLRDSGQPDAAAPIAVPGLIGAVPGDTPGSTGELVAKPHLIQRLLEITSAFFFMGMLISLLMGIYWRYVLNDPLVWSLEVAMICFIWAVMLGAPISDWEDNHLQFDLIYNKMSESVQFYMRTFGNLLLIGAFGVVTPASYRYLESVANRPVLGVSWLSLRIMYMSFVFFLVITVIQRSFLLVADVRRRMTRTEEKL
jgi:C4-dicarboxylate transporter DctQ subunit